MTKDYSGNYKQGQRSGKLNEKNGICQHNAALTTAKWF